MNHSTSAGQWTRTAERSAVTRVAWHESAHAVCAVVMSFRLTSATIRPSAEFEGLVHFNPWLGESPGRWVNDFGGDRSVVVREAIVLAAGPAAESHYTGNEVRWLKGRNDFDQAYELLKNEPRESGSIESYLYVQLIRADRLLRVPAVRNAVRLVALELLARETIDGPDAERIIRRELTTLGV